MNEQIKDLEPKPEYDTEVIRFLESLEPMADLEFQDEQRLGQGGPP